MERRQQQQQKITNRKPLCTFPIYILYMCEAYSVSVTLHAATTTPNNQKHKNQRIFCFFNYFVCVQKQKCAEMLVCVIVVVIIIFIVIAWCAGAVFLLCLICCLTTALTQPYCVCTVHCTSTLYTSILYLIC